MPLDPVLDQWIEEERTLKSNELEIELDGRGNPIGFKPITKERIVAESVAYASKIDRRICEPDQHYFDIRKNGKREHGRLIVQCRRCEIGKNYVVGVHRLSGGKIRVAT